MFSMGQSYDNIQANVPLVAHNRLRWQLCPKFSFSPSQYFIWDPNTKKILCSCAKAVAMQFRLGYYKQGCEAMKNWVTRDGYVLGQKEYIKVKHFHGENIESYLALRLTIHNNDTIFRWQKYFCFFNFNVCVIFTRPRCLWGPVYGSRCLYVRHFCETLLMWLWLMMIPTQYDWWCQYKAIPGNL